MFPALAEDVTLHRNDHRVVRHKFKKYFCFQEMMQYIRLAFVVKNKSI